MSEYKIYVSEKEKIDELINQGYQIKRVTENLSGAFVDFECKREEEIIQETLHILTAEGRKYFSAFLVHQK